MKIHEIDFSSIPNKQYTVKNVLLINNETKETFLMKKIATDVGCPEALYELIKGDFDVNLIMGRRADNCNNYSSPTTVMLADHVMFSRSALFLIDKDKYDVAFKGKLLGPDGCVTVGANKEYRLKVTNKETAKKYI